MTYLMSTKIKLDHNPKIVNILLGGFLKNKKLLTNLL